MEFFSGLDVSMERTAICVVDDKSEVQMQTEVVTDPDAIAAVLKPFLLGLRRAGHEAGSLSRWLQSELVKCGLPAVCLETKHARAAMSAQRNKTHATDALALAHIVRTGWFRQAHIESESCYRLRLLLTQQRNLKCEVPDLENTMRHSLKAFGIRIKGTGRTGVDAAVREAVADDALTSELMDAMLAARGDAVAAIPPAARSGGEVRRPPRALSALYVDPCRVDDDGLVLLTRPGRALAEGKV
jgi:transposase